jgi:lauroyl/myristoyl acyltransferase
MKMRVQHGVTIQTAEWQPEGWLKFSDLITAGKLICCLFASIAPKSYWLRLARLMARCHLRIQPRSIALLDRSWASVSNPRSLVESAIATHYLEDIQASRELLSHDSTCDLALNGLSFLEEALQQSRGAVLWCSPFVGADLAPKKALAMAGYKLTQLSAPSHPLSATRAGMVLLNPLRLCVENRYLQRRVVVVYGKSMSALAILADVLRNNGVVVIMALGAGKNTVSVPFMGGVMDLAVGAPRLAYQTGAALLPLFTLPHDDGYLVKLGRDLTRGAPMVQGEAVLAMVHRYTELLEPLVLHYPSHWKGWFHPATWRPV